MYKLISTTVVASALASAALLPLTANALLVNQPAGAVVSGYVVPYQCVPVAGCATQVSNTPVKVTWILKPYQCVAVAGCAMQYGW